MLFIQMGPGVYKEGGENAYKCTQTIAVHFTGISPACITHDCSIHDCAVINEFMIV